MNFVNSEVVPILSMVIDHERPGLFLAVTDSMAQMVGRGRFTKSNTLPILLCQKKSI